MLKLKLQYFGYLKLIAYLLEKTLILGKIEGRRRRGWQRMRWLHGITNSMDMLSLNEVLQLCLTLCNPMDCSLPGFSVHGILQARILEWVAISFSRGTSWPRDRTWVSLFMGRLYHLSHQGSPNGHEFELTPGDGKRQGSLACCSPWGGKESDTSEQLNTNKSAFKEKKASQASFLLEALKWLSTSAVCKTDPLFVFIN